MPTIPTVSSYKISNMSNKFFLRSFAFLSFALGGWLLPNPGNAQDVAFTLSQHTSADTLVVQLSGHSLDTQPDELTALVLHFDAPACLNLQNAEAVYSQPGHAGTYQFKVVATPSGFKGGFLLQNPATARFVLQSTPQELVQLRLPFVPGNCTNPSVQLSSSPQDIVLNQTLQALVQ